MEIAGARPAEPTLELRLHDRLDQLPAHPQVLSHVPHRHASGHLQHVAGEAPGIAVLARGEVDASQGGFALGICESTPAGA